jgi:DNA-binding NtrC family response regulator
MKTRTVLLAAQQVPLPDLKAALRREGWEVLEAFAQKAILHVIQAQRADLVVLGPYAGDDQALLAAAKIIRRTDPLLPLVMLADRSSEELAVGALRVGFNEYVRRPWRASEVIDGIKRQLEGENPAIGRIPASGSSALVGESSHIRSVRAYVRRVACSDCNVLITGETGTGKELIATLIHDISPRRARPLVCINCAAIPDTLLESELFGFEKGAFTGADAGREGKLRLAHGGSVFLDEIGDMTLGAQAKILRAIDTKHVHRLGGRSAVAVDIRVIAATNQDLDAAIQTGGFRKDLYFRLNVARVQLLPLRERKEDIPALIEHFIGIISDDSESVAPPRFSEDAMTQFYAYDWPGNVRELKNVVEASLVGRHANSDGLLETPEEFRGRRGGLASPENERDVLVSALIGSNWNKSKAAERLRWSRMTLYRKMAKYRVGDFKTPDKASNN